MQAGSGEVRGRGVNAKESEELMGNNAARFAPEAQGGVDVSVVIPCLNEANSIGICVSKAMEAFRAAGLRRSRGGGQRVDGWLDRDCRETGRAGGARGAARLRLRVARGDCRGARRIYRDGRRR